MWDDPVVRFQGEGSILERAAKAMAALTHDNPLALIHHTLFLPTRRSARAFEKCLAAHTEHGLFSPPRIIALTDFPPEAFDCEQSAILPTATERHLLMVELLRGKHFDALLGEQKSLPQLLSHASALLDQIDELFLFEVPQDNLSSLVRHDLPQNQIQALRVLHQVYSEWEPFLKRQGFCDPTQMRVVRYREYIKTLRDYPHPVIALGIEAAYGFVRDLLKAIMKTRGGAVILGGPEDGELSRRDSEKAHHPDFHLNRLLESMGCERSTLSFINSTKEHPRRLLLEGVFQNHTNVTTSGPLKEEETKNLFLLESGTLFEEAEAITLMMAEAVVDPLKTVALVTTNQTLTAYVMALLERFGIKADHSKAHAFRSTPLGRLLLLVASFLVSPYSPVTLLSLLKHPYVSLDQGRLSVLALARFLENNVMRTDRMVRGERDLFIKTMPEGEKALLTKLLNMKERGQNLLHGKEPTSLAQALLLLQSSLEELCFKTTLEGIGSIYDTPEGEKFKGWIASVMVSPLGKTTLEMQHFPSILRELMDAIPVSKAWGYHPRVFILGPLETRLLSFDRVILADFNEGRWPRKSSDAVWMNQRMRQDVGIVSDVIQMSQEADDLRALLSLKEVFITRALRVDGSPSVPSRWLLRLQAFCTQKNVQLSSVDHYKEWARLIWHEPLKKVNPLLRPLEKPMALPPLGARPKRLTISGLNLLKRNPYAFYVNSILKLNALKPLIHQLDALQFGVRLHQVLADALILEDSGSRLTHDVLNALGGRIFASYTSSPLWRYFWQHRLNECFDHFLSLDKNLSYAPQKRFGEVKVTFPFHTDFGDFEIIAKADRLDLITPHGAVLIDYKTGRTPTASSIKKGEDIQLALEGVMVNEGAFRICDAQVTKGLEYWDLKNGRRVSVEEVDTVIGNAESALIELLEQYYKVGAAYKINFDHLSDEIRHFSRWEEWIRLERKSIQIAGEDA